MTAEFGTSSPDSTPPLVPASHVIHSDAVATEACQLALNGVSELMSLMIHDLANPLQSLTMQLELSGDPGDDSSPLDIDSLLSTSEEVGQLLNKVSTFFYRRSPKASCQLRASLVRLQDALQQRLSSRGIRWEYDCLDIPEISHNCVIPELLLMRCLIHVGYERRQDRALGMRLRSNMILLRPYCATSPLDLRIHLDLLDHLGVTNPFFTLEKLQAIQTQMTRLGPGFSCSVLANHRVQLDFKLSCPR